ncbi:MAG: adenylosuccinate synthase [Bacteroidales bacterium]|nr:MAG: adenylosuccinate synthase [Bacteroidales bacterium]
MKVDVLLGLQWGDEGKGKIVDVLTPKYDVIARFQGGPNAGHSLEFNRIKHILHSIPSGIFHKNKINIIGNGVVLDPSVFKEEVDIITGMGVTLEDQLYISKKAHLILPSHRILDAASEASKGKTKIGSTLKGIGPAYMDKTGRNGLRVGDIQSGNFMEKYNFLVEKHRELLKMYDYTYDLKEHEKAWFEGIERISSFQIVDSEYFVNDLLREEKRFLAEGAQGTLLDIDFGSYPFVTSSNTVCSGACSGLGISPSRIGNVLGVFKAYCTRVGGGPFPTELLDETGEKMREKGAEFGATTGRPRRCGWLDLPALKYSIMLNGVDQLLMTKIDVLSGFPEIKICTGYRIDHKIADRIPFDIGTMSEPVFEKLPGWEEDISKLRDFKSFPEPLKEYIGFIESEVKKPVTMISVGPDRNQIIYKDF